MNPIDIIYCWQSLLVACVALSLTQLVKTSFDVVRGHVDETDTPTVRSMAKVGKARRQGDILLNRIVFPGCPLVFGVVAALVIPARPDAIMLFISEHEIGTNATAIYAAWGLSCGQFGDYIFSKAKGALGGAVDTVINRVLGRPPVTEPAPTPAKAAEAKSADSTDENAG